MPEKTIRERVAILENCVIRQKEDTDKIFDLIGEQQKANAETAKQQALTNAHLTTLAEKTAAQHTPENCPTKKVVDEHEKTLWFAKGGGKVLLWLLGGGLLAIGALIGALAKLAGH